MATMGHQTRRQFLSQTAAAASLAALPIRSRAQSATPETLKAAAASRGLLVGCCVHAKALREQPDYTALVKQQMSILVAENEFKFGPIHPQPTTFFFDDADLIIHFAEQNGMKMRGHNFVWHRALPPWFATYVTPQNAEQVLVNHIETVAGRYKGRIHSWDVVNEAIQVSDNLPGGMRNSPWQKVLPGYIDIAFRTARRVDPHAILTYNDYGIEADDPASATKRAAVLTLVRGMQQRNVPIDAIGIQSHLSPEGSYFEMGPPPSTGWKNLNNPPIYPTYRYDYSPALTKFMADIQSLGLKIMLTEMDVNDRNLPADIPTRDRLVGAVYAHYLDVALSNKNVLALLTWGITDRSTWLNHEGARKDGVAERALPFDADLKPTPAFASELNALHAAPSR